jgi:hypothetical protein
MSSVWVVTHTSGDYCPAFELVAVRLTEAEADAFVAGLVARYDAVLARVGPEPHVDGLDEEDCRAWGAWWDQVATAIETDPQIALVRDGRDGFSVREMPTEAGK